MSPDEQPRSPATDTTREATPAEISAAVYRIFYALGRGYAERERERRRQPGQNGPPRASEDPSMRGGREPRR